MVRYPTVAVVAMRSNWDMPASSSRAAGNLSNRVESTTTNSERHALTSNAPRSRLVTGLQIASATAVHPANGKERCARF